MTKAFREVVGWGDNRGLSFEPDTEGKQASDLGKV